MRVFLQRLLWIGLGVIAGAFVLSAVRAAVYQAAGFQPEMAPGMFIVFAPVIAFLLTALAAIVEGVATAAGRPFSPKRGANFFLGLTYSMLYAPIINPIWGGIALALLNPITARVLVRKVERSA